MIASVELRRALVQVLETVPSIGTVDEARIDPDEIPRRLRAANGAYWAVGITSRRDQLGSWGGLNGVSATLTEFGVTIEGWLGFAAASDYTETWDTLVERVLDRLQGCQSELGRRVPGFVRLDRLQATRIGVVEPRDRTSRGYRAHFARLEMTADIYREVTH